MDISTVTKQRIQKFKAWWTVDHVVDLLVDVALLFYDVIASPVLIVLVLLMH